MAQYAKCNAFKCNYLDLVQNILLLFKMKTFFSMRKTNEILLHSNATKYNIVPQQTILVVGYQVNFMFIKANAFIIQHRHAKNTVMLV
jgi:hypothetical protein